MLVALIHTHTHLHNDVEGKVEQQVANGDGQQIWGKVTGSLYEAVGSAVESKQPIQMKLQIIALNQSQTRCVYLQRPVDYIAHNK